MVKVLVSIDEALLGRIDSAAKRKGLSRSAYLAEVARQDLGTALGPGASKKASSALARLDELFAGKRGADSTATIRAARDAR